MITDAVRPSVLNGHPPAARPPLTARFAALLLDLYIIALTPISLLSAKNAY